MNFIDLFNASTTASTGVLIVVIMAYTIACGYLLMSIRKCNNDILGSFDTLRLNVNSNINLIKETFDKTLITNIEKVVSEKQSEIIDKQIKIITMLENYTRTLDQLSNSARELRTGISENQKLVEEINTNLSSFQEMFQQISDSKCSDIASKIQTIYKEFSNLDRNITNLLQTVSDATHKLDDLRDKSRDKSFEEILTKFLSQNLSDKVKLRNISGGIDNDDF